MPLVFRPSLRAVVLQGVLLAATSWLALRLGAQMDVRPATAATVAALGCLLAIRMVWLRPMHAVTLDDDLLRVTRDGDAREILLRGIERVELDAGALSDGGHTVHVGFARVVPRHGAAIAFADLSSLGGPSLRTPDGSAEIVDVGDPELLIALVAARAERLPSVAGEDLDDVPGALAQGLAPAPVTAARVVLAAVTARHLFAALVGPDADPLAAACGVMAAAAAHAFGRWVVQRSDLRSPSERGAPAGAALACATAATLPLFGGASLPKQVGAWSLAAAMALCLPAWPLPGGYVARRLGRACAALPPSLVALAVGATGLGAAALLSTSHVLLALALGAGLLEAMDGFHATRRHALIRAAPALWALPVPRLARLRARLRPFSESEVEGPTRARDLFELNLARQSPPPRQPLLLTAFALAATLAAALAARGLTGDAGAAGALRWLLW